MPSPVPVLAVTVQVVPLPDTELTEPPLTEPPWATAKSAVSTPVTSSLNVTVHETPAAWVGLAAPATRLMEETVGGVASLTTVTDELAVLWAVQLRNTAVTR